MSKVSAMQAMREARYSARPTTRAAVPPIPKPDPAAPVARMTTEDSGSSNSSASPDAVGQRVVSKASSTSPVDREPELALLPAEVITTAATDRPASDVAEQAPELLCGHRSMNSRNCRRPAGHPEKNHRYN